MSANDHRGAPAQNSDERKPVIIAGAGPAGLLAALVLERDGGVPYVVVERAGIGRVCSNSGSGFDLAPTAMSIMKGRLGLDVGGVFPRYDGLYVGDLAGGGENRIRATPFEAESYGASRSAMQRFFLCELLGEGWEDDGAGGQRRRTVSGMGELRCGSGLREYEESEDGVVARLDDGTEIVGSALLGCDGIHSAVRRQMMAQLLEKDETRTKSDDYNFCNINCWWGKTEIPSGSELQKLVDKTQGGGKGRWVVMMLGSRRVPGTFYLVRTGQTNTYCWALCLRADSPPAKRSDDLTRRGGLVLDEDGMEELKQSAEAYCPLIRKMIDETPAGGITKAGLFDRENLDLPYSTKGRVALVGDAAHPQSPFMGQGCNMALTDAYVLCTRLCRQPSVAEAIGAYDSEERRAGVNKVVRDARYYGDLSVSDHWFACWCTTMMMKFCPVSWLIEDMVVSGDRSNADFVSRLHEELGIE